MDIQTITYPFEIPVNHAAEVEVVEALGDIK